jgi:hypothetical protein
MNEIPPPLFRLSKIPFLENGKSQLISAEMKRISGYHLFLPCNSRDRTETIYYWFEVSTGGFMVIMALPSPKYPRSIVTG